MRGKKKNQWIRCLKIDKQWNNVLGKGMMVYIFRMKIAFALQKYPIQVFWTLNANGRYAIMKERRNLYRTLYAQPDAPLAVIKANHRILMQKLKLHPDQGFADLQASLLNTAYTVLQDPLKRADYDRQLQKRHPIFRR